MYNRCLAVAALLLVSACVSTPENPNGPSYLAELPEGLAEAAAPGQPLDRVRIMPDDGCYWYEYTNIVETTMLPLRTAEGRPICSRAQS